MNRTKHARGGGWPRAAPDSDSHPASLPFEKHVLANGLEVVLHEDHGQPVVAVYVYYHVGSSREEPGRSGFAHLFEHMLFQGSQNVPDNDHFRLIQAAGGVLNGTTSQDRTNYFETLPAEQLELALWLESDRMGFLLPAMTQAKLDNQRDVVMNERRQSYENRPYGLVHETMLAALYPSGHPYSWPTIGSMADIQAATLEDVTRFFRRFYGPNNATLAIGGDFEPARAMELVEHYFGALPRSAPVPRPRPEPAGRTRTERVVLEDRVRQPQLTLCWPTVPAGHPDEPALDLLADVLSANRSSLLDRALMIEEELASSVTIAHMTQERAGALMVNLRPHGGVTLTRLEARVEELLQDLASRGVEPGRMQRLGRRREGELFRSLETVAARTSRLGFDNLFYQDPGRLALELARRRAVTATEVTAALQRYLLARPRVVLSCVPHGQRDLAAADRPLEELVPCGSPPRAVPPPASSARTFRSPPLWQTRLDNGVALFGAHFDQVPMARVSLSLSAGSAYEPPVKRGLARLVGEMLEEGTQRLSGNELVDELDGLGAQLSVSVGDEDLILRLAVLAECLPRALALLAELVLEPRFAAADLERLRKGRALAIATRSDRIGELADEGFARVIFGPTHPKGAPHLGTQASLERTTLADLVAFFGTRRSPQGARLAWVGPKAAEAAAAELAPFVARFTGEPAPPRPAFDEPRLVPGLRLHFIDKPGAAQSELRLGHIGVASTHPDFYPLQALNQVLGGAFSSRLNLNLREDKGYTYGVHSAFDGGLTPGLFTVTCAVAADVTAPALVEARRELEGLRRGVSQTEADFVRESLTRALHRSLESTQARLALLENLARHGHPLDLLERRVAWLKRLRAEELEALAQRHLHPDALDVLVVGDGARVRSSLEGLGWGPVRELDAYGEPLQATLAGSVARP